METTTAVRNTLQVYRRRWLVLAAIAFQNVICGVLWLSFSTIKNEASTYYGKSVDDIALLSTSMFIVNALFGVLAMWVLDKVGLKQGIRIGIFVVTLGCVLRAASTRLRIPNTRQYYVTLFSQWVIAFGQPFILFTPTKVAELWFANNERVTATTVISMGTPLGFIISSLVAPFLVTKAEEIPKLNCYLCIPAIIGLVMCLVCVRSSKPPSPPSASAAIQTNRPFFRIIVELITENAFLILLLYVGSAIGILFALVNNLSEIVEAKGYNETDCGIFSSILMAGGVLGALIASYVADATKKFIPIMKISACCLCVSLCALFVIVRYREMHTTISVISALTGFFAFMAYPLGVELGIECSFPNSSEASCNGLLLISGQLQGIIFIQFMRLLAKVYNNGLYDYSISLMSQSGLNALSGCVFIIFFYTEYKRMTSDRKTYFENILSSDSASNFESSIHSTNGIYS